MKKDKKTPTSGTWPDDINDGLEKAIDRLRCKNENSTKIIKGLRDLRYGIFKDQKAVNDLLDELIVLAEDTQAEDFQRDCPGKLQNELIDALKAEDLFEEE